MMCGLRVFLGHTLPPHWDKMFVPVSCFYSQGMCEISTSCTFRVGELAGIYECVSVTAEVITFSEWARISALFRKKYSNLISEN